MSTRSVSSVFTKKPSPFGSLTVGLVFRPSFRGMKNWIRSAGISGTNIGGGGLLAVLVTLISIFIVFIMIVLVVYILWSNFDQLEWETVDYGHSYARGAY